MKNHKVGRFLRHNVDSVDGPWYIVATILPNVRCKYPRGQAAFHSDTRGAFWRTLYFWSTAGPQKSRGQGS